MVVRALNQSQLTKDHVLSSSIKIAIIGSGILGLLLCQILRKRFPNISITIIDRHKFKLEFATKIATNDVSLEISITGIIKAPLTSNITDTFKSLFISVSPIYL